MLVMGIDPGTRSMGIGLVESDGEDFFLRHSDALSPPRNADLAERLGWLHVHLAKLITEVRPDVVAVESPVCRSKHQGGDCGWSVAGRGHGGGPPLMASRCQHTRPER